MKSQQFEELAKKYPALFEKSTITTMSIGDGWYDLVDALCEAIYSRYDRNDQVLREMINQNADEERIQGLRHVADACAAELPVVVQVKEKFGSLRFYMRGGTDEMFSYEAFASLMSTRICEVCGARGHPRNEGWVKTLCDTHHRERQAERDPVNFSKTNTFSSDEE